MKKIYLILLALLPFKIFAQCSVSIVATDSNVCSGTSLSLFAIGSGGDTTSVTDSSIASFTWAYDTVSYTIGSYSNSYAITPTTTTKYFVTATYKNSCIAKDSIIINVINSVLPTFSTTGCALSDTLSINGASGGTTYQWYKNDTLLGTTNDSYVATAPGSYTASAINSGCTYSFGPVYYSPAGNPLPVEIVTQPGSDSLLSVSIFNTDSIQWYNNGQLIPGSNNRYFTADSSGNYSATIHSYGCVLFSDTVNVTILPPPSIISTGTPACSGSDTLKVNSIGANGLYTWYNNGAVVALTVDTFYVAHYSGNYSVTLWDTITNVSFGSNGYELTGLPLQSGILFQNATCGRGDSTQLSVLYLSNTTYQWSKNDSVLSGQTNSWLGAKSAGNYAVTITFSINGCSYTYDSTVTVHTSPIPTISKNATGDSLIVTVSGGVPPYNYQWYGAFYQNTSSNKIFISDTLTNYNVTVTDSNGCTGSSPNYSTNVNTVSGTVYNSSFTRMINVPVYVVVLHSDNSTAVLDSSITDASGNFSMTTIATNGYILAVSDSSTYLPTYDSSASVIQNAISINFTSSAFGIPVVLINAAQSSGSGQISGVIDSSALVSARQGLVLRTASTGSAPIGGLKIILLNASNQPVATTTTNASGFFQFTNLATGNYKLWVDGYGIDNSTAPVVIVSSGSSSGSTNLQLALSGTSLRVTGVTAITSAASTTSGISVYPNPTSSSFSISVSGSQFSNFSYTLTDGQGNQLLKGQSNSTIDVSGIEPGLYILSVQTPETVGYQKVIIER